MGRASRLERWSPLGGLVWFVSYPIGFVLGTGEGETATEVIERAESNEAGIGIVLLVVLLSPLLLGLFLAGLCARLRASGTEVESRLVLVGGTVFVALLFLADTLVFAPLSELPNHEGALQSRVAETIPVLEDVSWWVQGGAGVGAALMIMSASIGVRRCGALSGWTFWMSLLLGVVSLFTIAFVGVFAWLLWIGLASIWMLVRSRSWTTP